MKILNWNKIRNNPVTVQFLLWAILLVADSILNVFVNHGAWWGLCVIATGLVAFFLPRESKIIFGILLMILPVGGILEKRKTLSAEQYQTEKARLEIQKEVFDKSKYQKSNTNLNCQFEGKHATYAKLKCQSALLALESTTATLHKESKEEETRIRIKNERLDREIGKIEKSINLITFLSDPDIFRGLLASIFLPLIQISMSIFTRKENEITSKLEPTSGPGTTEKQMSNAAINSLIELKLKEHKNKVAKVIYDLKTEYELDVYRGRIYEVKRRIQKVSDFEIEQNRTKSDSDQTLIGQEPDKVPTNAGQKFKETFVTWRVENGKS